MYSNLTVNRSCLFHFHMYFKGTCLLKTPISKIRPLLTLPRATTVYTGCILTGIRKHRAKLISNAKLHHWSQKFTRQHMCENW